MSCTIDCLTYYECEQNKAQNASLIFIAVTACL